VNVKDTTSRGDIAEFQVVAALVRQGRRLLRPLSSASRYDLLIDNADGTFTRVQCKSGVLREGCVLFRLYSVSGHDTRAKGYEGQVDAFGVYCADTSATSLVPVEAIASCGHMAAPRVEPTRNGQRRGVRSAAEFVIA
jgi:hypothetical protein